MPFCNKCGQEISNNINFCPNCGTPIGTVEETFSVSSNDLVQKVKELVHEGNVRRIVILLQSFILHYGKIAIKQLCKKHIVMVT